MGSCHRNCCNVDRGYFGNFCDNDFVFEGKESNMKKFNVFLTNVLVTILIPASTVYGALPEVDLDHEERGNNLESSISEEAQANSTNDASSRTVGSSTSPAEPPALSGHISTSSLTTSTSSNQTSSVAAASLSATSDELEEALQDELLLPEGNQFWTKRKVTTGLLVLGGILATILLLLGGGKGGSSGSVGSIFEGGDDSNPNPGGGESGNRGNTNPPHNPEPSTFLLMSAGFALVFLRRKKA